MKESPAPTILSDDYPLASDVAFFAHHHILSEDIDPAYPVLRQMRVLLLGDSEPTTNGIWERSLWLTTLYLAYYNLPSAMIAFMRYPDPTPGTNMSVDTLKLPTGVERRGMRDPKQLRMHLDSYYELVGRQQREWLTEGWGFTTDRQTRRDNYERFWTRAQEVYGNGRWAAFKWAELLKDVHCYALEAPDMRLEFCSGPLDGLSRVTGVSKTADVATLNVAASSLARALDREWPDEGRINIGPTATRPEMDWEGLETVLCDFNSMAKGHYYVGHDIDSMQSQIETALSMDLPAGVKDGVRLLWRARRQSLPLHYLGEVNGWSGPDRARASLYARRRIIVVRTSEGEDVDARTGVRVSL